jgi:hypothetical protein
MNTSMIQDLTRVDSSRSTSSTRSFNSRSDTAEFKKVFESELTYVAHKRPDLNLSDDLTPEVQSNLPISMTDSGAKPDDSSVALTDSGKGRTEKDSSPDENGGTKEVGGKVESEEPGAGPGKKDSIRENGNAKEVEGKESGKNITPSSKENNGEAKNAARPSFPAGEKLTYGNVRKTENAVIGAGSAVSSSIQAVNVHHGTPHASSVSRPENGSPTEGSRRSGSMASNVIKNETSTKANMENEVRKMDFLSGMKPVSGSGSSSSNASFSSGQFDDGGHYSGKEGQGMPEVQLTAKPQFLVSTSTSQMVDSIRKMQSMIQDQVMVLKNINHQSMQVMIRPDNNMSLFLTLHQGDSEVFVAARMDGQTSGLLKPHWAELQKELEQHGIQLGDPEAQYEDQSRGQQWTQSNGDNDDFYGSQDFFLSPNQPAEDSQGNRESIHALDPDFENTQGTLVSWA